jgi:hypothetical protein
MRERKRSILRDPSLFAAWASNAAMGAAIGLSFSLVLLFFDRFGIKSLVAHSADPRTSMALFVGVITLDFAFGAGLTGFLLTIMERDERPPNR